MKQYESYMERQEVSTSFHEKLLTLEPPARRSGGWRRWGVLAACCVLAAGLGLWRLSPHQISCGDGSGGSPVSEQDPRPADTVPEITYRQETSGVADAIALPDGSFTRELPAEQLAALLAREGESLDSVLAALGWTDYALRGEAIYDGAGQLWLLTVTGQHPDGPEFTLELCPGELPPTCVVTPAQETAQVNGASVSAWYSSWDRDGDRKTEHVCRSEFMAGDVGVRYENVDAPFTARYGSTDGELGGAQKLNAMAVGRIIGRGIELKGVMTAENVPAWREESFSSLNQARQEEEFAPYLPAENMPGYGEFYGRLSWQEGSYNDLFVRWSRGYDDVEVAVCRCSQPQYALADVNAPEQYDVRLYDIPWSESVPEEYRDTVYDPVFRAEDMSFSVVQARTLYRNDTGEGRQASIRLGVLHPDGTVVRYTCKGLTAEQVWAMVEPTLTNS